MKSKFLVLIICLIAGVLLAQGKSTITDSYNAETAKNYTRALEIVQEIAKADANDEFYQLRIGWLPKPGLLTVSLPWVNGTRHGLCPTRY